MGADWIDGPALFCQLLSAARWIAGAYGLIFALPSITWYRIPGYGPPAWSGLALPPVFPARSASATALCSSGRRFRRRRRPRLQHTLTNGGRRPVLQWAVTAVFPAFGHRPVLQWAVAAASVVAVIFSPPAHAHTPSSPPTAAVAAMRRAALNVAASPQAPVTLFPCPRSLPPLLAAARRRRVTPPACMDAQEADPGGPKKPRRSLSAPMILLDPMRVRANWIRLVESLFSAN
jgi:hypothetical protein